MIHAKVGISYWFSRNEQAYYKIFDARIKPRSIHLVKSKWKVTFVLDSSILHFQVIL